MSPGSSQYETLMKRALKLAKKAEGDVNHYPMVGAVLIKNGDIVGEGFFSRPGEPHAEVNAIRAAGPKVKGATLVLNLEPCSHFGTTPPCSDAVIQAGIKRVVAGMTDPNPKVSGKGFKKLRAAGVEVIEGVLEEECRLLNEVFVKFITTGRPFVTLKAAITLGGAIATRAGDSKWISSEESRKVVHKLRDASSAVMVGAGTIIADDPELTVRLAGKGRHPRPVVVDSRLSLPIRSKVMSTPAAGGPIIACTRAAASQRVEVFRNAGAEVWQLRKDRDGLVDLNALMDRLGQAPLGSVLLEGGALMFGAALRAGIVDKAVFFIAPKLLCGEGISMTGGPGPDLMSEALGLARMSVKRVGEDLMVVGYPA